jgi:hypothetical protein
MKGRPIEHESWWRMPPPKPLPARRPGRSWLWWTAPYWVLALAIAWAIHADIIRLRDRVWMGPMVGAPLTDSEVPAPVPRPAGSASASGSAMTAPPPDPGGRRGRSTSGRSCAEAMDAYVKHGANGEADQTESRHGTVLNAGAYFAHCGIPDTMRLHLCTAVKNGRVADVTVHTRPKSEPASKCVATAVRALSFPVTPGHGRSKLDVTTTVF